MSNTQGVQVEIMTSKGLHCRFFKDLKAEDIDWVRLRELGNGKPKPIIAFNLNEEKKVDAKKI